MLAKIHQICPSCFSTRIRVRIGGGGYREDGIYKVPEDFGEIYECPDCSFQGPNILDGNLKLADFLKQKKLALKQASILKKQVEAVQEIKVLEFQKPLAIVDVQAKLL